VVVEDNRHRYLSALGAHGCCGPRFGGGSALRNAVGANRWVSPVGSWMNFAWTKSMMSSSELIWDASIRSRWRSG